MRSLLAALVCLSVIGCGDDETTSVDVGPSGPPSLALVDPTPQAEPTCRAIGSDFEARIPFLVSVDEVMLRPPGACGSFAQCGHLALYADGVLNNRSVVETIDLLVGELEPVYHDGTPDPETGEPDVLTVRIELLDEEGVPFEDEGGAPVATAIDLLVSETCPP